MALAPGSRLGPYDIVGPLGAGGMGEVYRARDSRLDRIVALKVLPGDLSHDPERRERFEREARAASRLSHPHICTIHDIGEEDGQPYLVMELLKGRTLREQMQAGKLPPADVLRIGAQVADALVAAHAEGIVHRDITPANIFVTEHGEVKVLDFGLAKLQTSDRGTALATDAATRHGSDLTGLGTALGTLAYMSPEQVLGRRTDGTTDVFSLGVVLYEMASGSRPFQGETIGAITDEILHKDAVPPLRSHPGLPAGLATLIGACLRKDPKERCGAAEVRDRLNDMLATMRGERADFGAALARWGRRPTVWGSALVVLVALAAGGAWLAKERQHERWVRDVALPKLLLLAEGSEVGGRETVAAYRAALEIERDLAGDPGFARLMAQVSVQTSIDTDPLGATVYAKPREQPDAPWELVGVTPVTSCRLPRVPLRFKVEKPGFETLLRTALPWGYDPQTRAVGPGTIKWSLDKDGSTPAGMVWIDATQELPRFLVDQHEVTNREFKAFVRGGGYRNRGLWKVPFVKNGKPVAWDEAAKEFVDRTGQPGPSTWEAGDYPEGEDDFPVTGVSWYEAVAYAGFVDKELPTVRHWEAAAGGALAGRFSIETVARLVVSLSNFNGKGPARVATRPNTTTFEVFDLGGNAREWCWNERGVGRAIRGGAWDDHTYMFGSITQAPPFDRSPRNGFRCVRIPDRERVPATVFAAVPRPPIVRDFSKERQVADAVFVAYRQQYAYDAIPIDSRVEARVVGSDWIREKVSFTAAYGGERVVAQVFLPTKTPPPYQVVVYFPGSSATSAGSSDVLEGSFEFFNNLAFFVKSGRVVVYPVYKGTHERRIPVPRPCNETHDYATYQRELVQDVRRTIDYLETRPDIDSSRIAYDAWSWGGRMSSLVLGVETRFKTAIIVAGGLRSQCRTLPEADAFNFAPRVTLPVLMLHGRYDLNVAWETDGKPLFDLLGTRPPDKVLKLYNTDHFIPRKELIQESLAWLDKYLGPVNR